jgi:hypothetical protein
LLPAHQARTTQRAARLFRLFVFCLSVALYPIVLLAVVWLFSTLLNCSFQAHSCEYLPTQAERPILTLLFIIFIYGVYGLFFTVPAGVILFVFVIIIGSLSRKNLINWINAIFLLPMILVFISGVIWLSKLLLPSYFGR